MKHSIVAIWQENLKFEVNQPGGKISLDADTGVGGTNEGLNPKALMLTSLAGCTGMDVASLMKKMRADQAVSNFTITIDGTLTEEHPKHYNEVSVVYTFEGKEMDQKKIEKAVNLSIERYCGVFEMFRSFATITTKIIFEEQ